MHPHIHWDDCPDGTRFSIEKFRNGDLQGLWGIVAQPSNDLYLWLSLGDPAEVVQAQDKKTVERILIHLHDSTSAIKNAAETESRLMVNDSLPVISWQKVTPDSRLEERCFSRGSWVVVAVLPDGDHLVVFDEFAQNSGYRTMHKDRESARNAIAFLEATFPPVPPFTEEAGTEIPREMIEADLEEIEYIAMGWHARLYHGKRESCICGQCRHEYNRRLGLVAVQYEERYGFVPSLIFNAVDETLSGWKDRENGRPPINWYRV